MRLLHHVCPPVFADILLPDASHYLNGSTELAAVAFQRQRMLHNGSPMLEALQSNYSLTAGEPDGELVPAERVNSSSPLHSFASRISYALQLSHDSRMCCSMDSSLACTQARKDGNDE